MVCYYHEGYCVLTPTDPILYLVRVTIYFALKVIRLSEHFVDIKKHQTDVNTSLAKYVVHFKESYSFFVATVLSEVTWLQNVSNLQLNC